ncbi:uncharacterized protein B0I36DRAFT_343957 [Microdochium trichocladiopsis]|uniref:Uncharacterized protein n=1 Tax=Microdochium trichocladiopsis TaxID=1682393 RepID=A0A9P9BZJ2_9PEZI|nr:uncharacterized protein B0I36DRAFT_343957 [Microdochium trichocladiopsis]KAH7040169.1 hypothetical protein B0I36DRAFT_343957 [Microdochium trichocladiopsis]
MEFSTPFLATSVVKTSSQLESAGRTVTSSTTRAGVHASALSTFMRNEPACGLRPGPRLPTTSSLGSAKTQPTDSSLSACLIVCEISLIGELRKGKSVTQVKLGFSAEPSPHYLTRTNHQLRNSQKSHTFLAQESTLEKC